MAKTPSSSSSRSAGPQESTVTCLTVMGCSFFFAFLLLTYVSPKIGNIGVTVVFNPYYGGPDGNTSGSPPNQPLSDVLTTSQTKNTIENLNTMHVSSPDISLNTIRSLVTPQSFDANQEYSSQVVANVNSELEDAMIVESQPQDTDMIGDYWNLVFVHVPKTGGSTIENFFKYQYGILYSYVYWAAHEQRGTRFIKNPRLFKMKTFHDCCNCWHFPLTEYFAARDQVSRSYKRRDRMAQVSDYYGGLNYNNMSFSFKEIEYFAVVRNPYDRYLSQYHYATLERRGFFHGTQEIDKLDDYCTPESLNHFTRKLMLQSSVMMKRTNKNKRKINFECIWDCHNVRQYDYTHYRGKQVVKYILKFENLNSELLNLLNRFKNTRNTASADLIMQNLNNEIQEKNCVNVNVSHLSRENLDLINTIYRKDFETYGYPML